MNEAKAEQNSEKYFNEKEYHTMYVGAAKENNPQSHQRNLVNLLIESENKDIRDEALSLLKKENGLSLLLDAISNPELEKHRPLLVAACWETGLETSDHLLFFVKLMIENKENYLLNLEILTVVENMEGPFKDGELKQALDQLNASLKSIKGDTIELFRSLKETLESFN